MKTIYYFIIFFLTITLNNFNFANEVKYIPQVDEVKELDVDDIKSLNKETKFIQTLDDNIRSSIGTQIYKKIAPVTVLVQTRSATGSGFVVDKEGHIVTNYHNIQIDSTKPDQFVRSVNLKFCPVSGEDIDDQMVYKADVVKIDPKRDLALLKLRSKNVIKNFSPAKLDYSDKVQIGMSVHAIGHPEGYNCTYTQGVTSQIRKNYEWCYDAYNCLQATVIQTQTPINPGNSGGPLISDEGLIIGINSFVHKETEGIAFAVASIEIQDFLDMEQTLSKERDENKHTHRERMAER